MTVLVVGLLALAAVIVRATPWQFSLDVVFGLIGAVIAVYGAWSVGKAVVRIVRGPMIANQEQYVAAHLQIGRCPSCAASLRGVTVNQDGQSWTCPRCESRWTPGWTGKAPK
jgi:hypothetical protein